MAKDDYDVIVFKVLAYYYARLKRKVAFDKTALEKLISKADIPEEYFIDVLRMMQDEGLISGVNTRKAWGNEYILISELSSIRITPDGIHYLKDNSKMRDILKAVKSTAGLLSSLVDVVLP